MKFKRSYAAFRSWQAYGSTRDFSEVGGSGGYRSPGCCQAALRWYTLLAIERVFVELRPRFIGKCYAVHSFWGSFDLAVTRFSGHRAPERPGADRITREAYSHEVSSVGFWPGSDNIERPAFYSYAAPEPEGFRQAAVGPETARYDAQLGEFILMYEDVLRANSPSAKLLESCQSTYQAGAILGNWDRNALERPAAPIAKPA